MEEMKAVRSRLMWEACLPPGARMTSEPRLLPKAMSGSMILPQPGSVWTSMVHVVTKDHRMSRAWAATCGHGGVQALYHCWIHAG